MEEWKRLHPDGADPNEVDDEQERLAEAELSAANVFQVHHHSARPIPLPNKWRDSLTPLAVKKADHSSQFIFIIIYYYDC